MKLENCEAGCDGTGVVRWGVAGTRDCPACDGTGIHLVRWPRLRRWAEAARYHADRVRGRR